MPRVTCYKPGSNVIFQTVDNETVIINLDNGRYYSLNATASFIWDALAQHYPLGAINDALSNGLDAEAPDIAGAMEHFLDELEAEGLVVGDTAVTPNAAPLRSTVRYEPPQLEKFTDMEKLIPLDPIHQVGTMGWPFTQEKQD